jgi:hypothetical protein
VALRLVPASEHGREHPEPERDRPERLLRVRHGVLFGVREEEVVQLLAAPNVADQHTRLGQRADVDDPEPVSGKVGEVLPRVALHLRAGRTFVTELGRHERVAPAGDPWVALRMALDPRPELV